MSRSLLLSAVISCALLASACADDNDDGYDCRDLGELMTDCWGCTDSDATTCDDNNAELCVSAIDSGDPEWVDYYTCWVDCEPETCDELSSCSETCSLE